MKSRILFLLIALFLIALPIQAQDADITIARDVSLGDVTPIQAADVFPDTLTAVFAVVELEDLDPGEEIDIIWYFEGDELDTLEFENDGDEDDITIWTNWSDPDGLEAGDWEVQIEYDGDVIGSEEFEITDDEYIFPVRFGGDCGRGTGQLVNEGTEFEDAIILYAYIEYANFDEESVRAIWVIDGEEFDLGLEYEFDGDDWECISVHNSGDPLPDGEYGIIITDDGGDEFYESDDSDNAELES